MKVWYYVATLYCRGYLPIPGNSPTSSVARIVLTLHYFYRSLQQHRDQTVLHSVLIKNCTQNWQFGESERFKVKRFCSVFTVLLFALKSQGQV